MPEICGAANVRFCLARAGRKANIRAGRLTNEVITHTHHHPGPGNNAHTEAECRAAVSNRFGIKWRCLTAGGVHVAELSGDLGVATKEPRKGRPAAIGRELQRLVNWILQCTTSV